MSSELVNRDADMAAETEKCTSDKIVVEASSVMRVQAFICALNVLNLLGRVSLALMPKRTGFTENLQERPSDNWVLDLDLINFGSGKNKYKESVRNL